MPSSTSVIVCENLGKTYIQSRSPFGQFIAAVRAGGSGHSTAAGDADDGVEALRSLNVSICGGESVGIIGRNGSGKSTLLQMICGVLCPTSGRVSVQGKVAALLELGSGFDPDFTGRENVFFAGSLLGFSDQEIHAAYPQIEQFAGIGSFIDRPVRCYSSGMRLRLAFSVYTMVRPDILIIDEALAVGDEGFQRKCYRRLETLREAGTTLLFVSHSPAAVIQLCDRVVWLEAGRLVADGEPKAVMDAYHRFNHLPPESRQGFVEKFRGEGAAAAGPAVPAAANAAGVAPASFDPSLASQSRDSYPPRGCEIRNFKILDPAGEVANVLQRNKRYRFSYEVTFTEACYGVFFAMFIKGLNGTELGGMTEPARLSRIPEVSAGSVYQVEFTFQCLLTHGVYFINAGVEKLENEESVFAHRVVDAVLFRVIPDRDTACTGIIDFQISPKRMHHSTDE